MYYTIGVCVILSACATPQQMVYVRIDGKTIPDNPALLETFNTDKTICLGDMAKADVSGTVISSNNVFIDAQNRAERSAKTNTVMAGCMAQKGYKLVAVAPATYV